MPAKIEEFYIKNKVFVQKDDTIKELESSPLINVKELPDGIRSFNFKREVFYGNKFDSLNIKARGLFVYYDNTIAARSYDKFFNVYMNNSKPEDSDYQDTYIENVKNKLTFPVQVYLKYNGYLGLLSWNKVSNDWLIASKSTTEKEFAGWFRELLSKKGILNDTIKQYIIDNNVTLIFEVIDIDNDPHIIEYDESNCILLDIIKNDFKNDFLSYSELISLSGKWGLKCKELITTINSYDELINFLQIYESYDCPEHIEGFVITDKNGYMIKYKTYYYRYWKECRKILQLFLSGKLIDQNKITKDVQPFYNWLIEHKEQYKNSQSISIIDMRKEYEK